MPFFRYSTSTKRLKMSEVEKEERGIRIATSNMTPNDCLHTIPT